VPNAMAQNTPAASQASTVNATRRRARASGSRDPAVQPASQTTPRANRRSGAVTPRSSSQRPRSGSRSTRTRDMSRA
jgi:hypothetical protein